MKTNAEKEPIQAAHSGDFHVLGLIAGGFQIIKGFRWYKDKPDKWFCPNCGEMVKKDHDCWVRLRK